jgi:hypothetical protein
MRQEALNIPENLWHSTLLVESKRKFTRHLQDPQKTGCIYFFLSPEKEGIKPLKKEDVERLLRLGYQQVKIGLNCIIY